MSLWPHFTKDHPCPACGHHDWTCRYGEKVYVCMRVESSWPNINSTGGQDGGFIHSFNSSPPPLIPYLAPPKKKTDAVRVHQRLTSFGTEIADKLGVSMESLVRLSAAWSDFHNALGFPMRDADNNIVGIRWRWEDGMKRSLTGAAQGLFIPQCDDEDLAILPEGPTSTAAALTLGFYAVGRPNCNSGGELVTKLLNRLGVRRTVIVADHDELKKDGRRPGLQGALKLKKEIGIKSVIWMPPHPCKDIRDFLKRGGTREMIMSDIKDMNWTKG